MVCDKSNVLKGNFKLSYTFITFTDFREKVIKIVWVLSLKVVSTSTNNGFDVSYRVNSEHFSFVCLLGTRWTFLRSLILCAPGRNVFQNFCEFKNGRIK